jgi:hypothetical protein
MLLVAFGMVSPWFFGGGLWFCFVVHNTHSARVKPKKKKKKKKTNLWCRTLRSALALPALLCATLFALFSAVFPLWRADPATLADLAGRLFPFGRGLYEDMVPSVWCALSPVWKLKAQPPAVQRLVAAAATVAAAAVVAAGAFVRCVGIDLPFCDGACICLLVPSLLTRFMPPSAPGRIPAEFARGRWPSGIKPGSMARSL